jgi:hypothetical protein
MEEICHNFDWIWVGAHVMWAVVVSFWERVCMHEHVQKVAVMLALEVDFD